MGNYFDTNFAYGKNHSISRKVATFDTSSTDPIKSPVSGTVETKDSDSLTIMWRDGLTRFIVSNLTPENTVSTGQRISTIDKIGTAKGKVKLKITKGGSEQKIEDYIKPEEQTKNQSSNKDYDDKYDSLLYKRTLKDDEKWYRSLDDLRYLPANVVKTLAQSATDRLSDTWGNFVGLKKESVESRKLNEEVERIKKLLK